MSCDECAQVSAAPTPSPAVASGCQRNLIGRKASEPLRCCCPPTASLGVNYGLLRRVSPRPEVPAAGELWIPLHAAPRDA